MTDTYTEGYGVYSADYDEGWDEDDPYYENDSYCDDPCDHCGPWCPDWGGDGLCMIQIQQQADEEKEFYDKYVIQNYYCPVCGKPLTLYKLPITELWTWPGDFYDPMIALNIYAVYDAPKGELHRLGDICHIWVGSPESDNQKLIRLAGDKP